MAEVRSYISESYESVFLFVIHLLCSVVHGLSFKESFETKPFVSIWNAPSLKCETKFGVNLNLSYFDIVANSGDHFEGNEVVIFYKNELGRYPWIREDGTFVNGGLPQVCNRQRSGVACCAECFEAKIILRKKGISRPHILFRCKGNNK